MLNLCAFLGGMLFTALLLALGEVGHRAANRRELRRRIQQCRPRAMQDYHWN